MLSTSSQTKAAFPFCNVRRAGTALKTSSCRWQSSHLQQLLAKHRDVCACAATCPCEQHIAQTSSLKDCFKKIVLKTSLGESGDLKDFKDWLLK